jgi:hypothetical protein
VLQDCSQTSSQHAVSAVTPQRAIINIALQAVLHESSSRYKIHVIHSFDDAGKIWCCRTAHRPAVNMLLSAVTPQRAIINIAVQAVCYTNELAAGVQNYDTPLMMLARFCCRTAHRPAVKYVLGCDATTFAIINIAAQVLHNSSRVQICCTPFDAGKICCCSGSAPAVRHVLSAALTT